MPMIRPTSALALALCWLVACTPTVPPIPSGAEDFANFCAACHGDGGRGDGPLGAVLDRRPADLTGLAARNGGVFPAGRVMAKIWGYAEAEPDPAMPGFGTLLHGDMIRYDSGDGIATPTPIRLVQLAQYLEALQP